MKEKWLVKRGEKAEKRSFKACTFAMFLTNTNFLWCHTLIFPFRGMLKHKGEISTDVPCVFLCINISAHKHRHAHTHRQTHTPRVGCSSSLKHDSFLSTHLERDFSGHMELRCTTVGTINILVLQAQEQVYKLTHAVHRNTHTREDAHTLCLSVFNSPRKCCI